MERMEWMVDSRWVGDVEVRILLPARGRWVWSADGLLEGIAVMLGRGELGGAVPGLCTAAGACAADGPAGVNRRVRPSTKTNLPCCCSRGRSSPFRFKERLARNHQARLSQMRAPGLPLHVSPRFSKTQNLASSLRGPQRRRLKQPLMSHWRDHCPPWQGLAACGHRDMRRCSGGRASCCSHLACSSRESRSLWEELERTARVGWGSWSTCCGKRGSTKLCGGCFGRWGGHLTCENILISFLI